MQRAEVRIDRHLLAPPLIGRDDVGERDSLEQPVQVAQPPVGQREDRRLTHLVVEQQLVQLAAAPGAELEVGHQLVRGRGTMGA